MNEFIKYIGLDTHKETIAVAIADGTGGKPRFYGEIANTPTALSKLMKDVCPNGEVVSFCYEAGPCGYGIYRQIIDSGHECSVVAPSLIPTKPGDRVKTDRRDSENLARLHRTGELTSVWVPDQEQEAIRDLTSARADMKLWDWSDFEIVHINEIAGDAATAAHLLKYDSQHGTWAPTVVSEGDNIIIDGKPLSYSRNQGIEETEWAKLGCDIVVECTGKFKSKEALTPYLEPT